MHYSRLVDIISSYIDLYPQDINLIRSFFHYDSVPKGTSLIEFGEKVDKTFFILSGYLPELEAKTIFKAANSRSSKLRYTTDFTTKALFALRSFIPLTVFQNIVKMQSV